MLIMRSVVGMLSVGLIGLGAGAVSGQAYPSKPIRLFASTVGGGTDLEARLIAPGISGQYPINQSPSFSMMAVNSLCIGSFPVR